MCLYGLFVLVAVGAKRVLFAVLINGKLEAWAAARRSSSKSAWLGSNIGVMEPERIDKAWDLGMFPVVMWRCLV